MNRRMFSQLLALGAGFFAAGQAQSQDRADADGNSDQGNDQSAPETSIGEWQSPPVTVQDFVARAKAKLPKASFDYITTGSEDEVTLKDNVEAFRRIRVLPPLMHGVNETDLSTTVLGEKISLPVIIAPVAGLRMFHPQGARASARAATRAGTICAVSSSAMNSVEEVAAATDGPLWFQIYVPRDRDVTKRLVRRAEASGYKAIVVTVDLGERKDADLRNRFSIPKDMLLKHLRDIGYTHLNEKSTYEELSAFNASAWDLSLSWDFFKWLRGITRLPILVKGVLTPDAAEEAIKVGLNGVIVSNHGGRRLDGMPASIDMLRDVVQAADGRIEVLMDSGVRRGGDVLKALALGAKAVLVGRPQAWSLAAGGEAGVKRMLDILRDELTNAMVSSGCASVADVSDELLMPPHHGKPV